MCIPLLTSITPINRLFAMQTIFYIALFTLQCYSVQLITLLADKASILVALLTSLFAFYTLVMSVHVVASYT